MTWGPPGRHVSSTATMPQPVHPQPCWQEPDQHGQDRAVDPVEPGPRMARRSTATSCRSTSSSAFFDADDRPSRISHPQSRTKMR
jgi:hypothetical protein